jgi:hypothetical protein
MLPVGFELAIPASKRPQTHATGASFSSIYEGVSTIFRTDAVKIINLTTKRV